ncbi:MAG: pyruvate kinase [Candidatus Thermoplasmatota archaeon]|nr:pyruvate kinase [Candidatus Thermoplasmatota archaeon]
MVNIQRLSRTKIVCTIGPASTSRVKALVRAGMSCARLNLVHGNIEEHIALADRIRRISDSIAILADLPGPKIRLGKLKIEPRYLKRDEVVELSEGMEAEDESIPVDYAGFLKNVDRGDSIFINDGLIQLKVLEKEGSRVRCRVLAGGEILSHKGVNMPAKKLEYDRTKDLELCEKIADHVDAIGVSFVSDERDVEAIKAKAKGAEIIAKIERRGGVENIKSILESADGIMIARGDLGVEVGLENIPVAQKRLIREANVAGKPVITATQMLLSMVENKRPTRAEVADVANAILDGTDAVMLSEETAMGKHPIEAVRMMKRIALTTEKSRENFFLNGWKKERSVEDIISYDAYEAAEAMRIEYILTPTRTGGTPMRVSRFKPRARIIAFTSDERVKRFLSLSYGVYPVLSGEEESEVVKRAREVIGRGSHEKGKGEKVRVVLTRGAVTGKARGTNTLKIIEI